MSPAPDMQLPAAVEAERTLLGAVLLDGQAWDEVALVPKEAWSLDSHLRIRMGMKRLAAAGSAIDIVTLANHLTGRHEIENVGGVAYIAGLTEGLPRRPAIGDYIKIVNDKSVLRRLMIACTAAIQRAQDQSETGLEVLGSLQSRLEAIGSAVLAKRDPAIQTFIAETLADINREYQTKTSPCIPTGIPWLDGAMGGGLRHGNIFLVCARPNVGKTPMLLQMMVHNLRRGMKCHLFSFEKKREAILRDLIPHVVDVSNRAVNNAWSQTPEQNILVSKAMDTIVEWPFKIDDEKMDADQICWTIKRETRKGEELLFGLDHFGMVGSRRGEDPIERDNYISGSIRDTIKHTHSAFVILRQLRKVAREHADSPPVPDDVKGSGNAWEDAFGALFIHRAINPETRKMPLESLLNLAKLRTGGSTGSTKGTFNPRILRFDAEAELGYDADEWHQ